MSNRYEKYLGIKTKNINNIQIMKKKTIIIVTIADIKFRKFMI